MKKYFTWIAATVVAAFVIGCGGDDDTTITGRSPRVRAVNAIYGPDTTWVEFSESSTDNQSIAYGQVTDYAIVENEEQAILFRDAPGGTQIAGFTQQLLENNNFYTVVGVGGGVDQNSVFIINDRTSDPNNGSIDFRVVNAVNRGQVGDVNVWVIPSSSVFDETTPTFGPVTYGTTSDYGTTGSDTLRVVVSNRATNRIIADTTLQPLETNETYTIFILPGNLATGAETANVVVLPEGEDTDQV